MLALRCIVGDLRGGGRVLRGLPHVATPTLTSETQNVRHLHHHLHHHHLLLPPRRPPVLTQRNFLSGGPGSAGRRVKLRTRLAVALLVGGGLLGVWRFVESERSERRRRQRVEQLQRVAMGHGDFSLLDQTGRRRSKRDFLGRWVLLYFGFTHCPDVCPEELDKLSVVVATLDRDAALPPVQPVFITVDPERDDVAALARYAQDFHPRLLALTGTPEEVKAAGRDYRVYASAGPRDEDGDYIVDHTVLIYLLSPDGIFLDYYNRMKDQDQIAQSVRNHMRTYVSMATASTPTSPWQPHHDDKQ